MLLVWTQIIGQLSFIAWAHSGLTKYTTYTREEVMVQILEGRHLLSVGFFWGAKPLILLPLVTKFPIIGEAAAPSAPPITTSLTYTT